MIEETSGLRSERETENEEGEVGSVFLSSIQVRSLHDGVMGPLNPKGNF
jgi:hypothetical protein